MSTIADYSVFTKAFLASTDVDFSKLYDQMNLPGGTQGFRAFAVIPFNLGTPLTPREAMNFDRSKFGEDAGFGSVSMWNRVSCRDVDGNFIGNIVRVQPSKRDGSIRLVAKVAVTDLVSSEGGSNPADAPYNTFVLVRTDASTNIDLPIAVATISAGYRLHKHLATGNDPLDDVENANYVSFTINNLNGYTSVDFNPDAYATYDVTDALSRRVDVLEGKEGIEGLHLAFNSNTGDIILSDSKGNVIDQANLHIDADTIIADGEEGYKYVKTDINQAIHSAKAFMAPSPGEYGQYTSAFGDVPAVSYKTAHASLVRVPFGQDKMCNGIRVRWAEGTETYTGHDDIFCILWKEGNEEGTEPTKRYLSCCIYPVGEGGSVSMPSSIMRFKTASKDMVEWSGQGSDSNIYPDAPKFEVNSSVYSHDAFVHTVGNSSLADWDEFFKLAGFHDGDDIPMGTLLPVVMQMVTSGDIDPEEYIHGVNYGNAEKVVKQRAYAKEELVAWNKQHPGLMEDREHGTIIDHTGLDVRDGSITLGCGRIGKENGFQKVNYGIQMKERYGVGEDHNTYDSLDFTVSHHTGFVKFDENGHAAQPGGNTGLVPLTSSTLLSIEAGSYISGAPTCLILAKVSRRPKGGSISEGSTDPLEGSPVLTPVRMTAGFSVESSYDVSNGLNLTIYDDRDNIAAVFVDPDGHPIQDSPAIIEVQAIYTHPDANHETVPAQQMHTYIGKWVLNNHPNCSFLCNKIEEWMTAIDLTDTNTDPNNFTGVVGLYVVIRVY